MKFLKIFKDVTDLLQKDSARIYLVFLSFKKLNEAIRKSTFPDKNFIEIALLILKNNWNTHVNVSLVYASALLSHDHDFLNFDLITESEDDSSEKEFSEDKKIKLTIHEWISDWGSKFLKQFHFKNDSRSVKEFKIFLIKQITSFLAWSGKFFFLKSTWDLQKRAYQQIWDARDFWNIAKSSIPELGTVALAILNINPTEASVERSFAIQKYIHSNIRNKLGCDKIEAEMFLKFNENKVDEDNIFSESDDIFEINYNKKKIDQREIFLSDDESILKSEQRIESKKQSEKKKQQIR